MARPSQSQLLDAARRSALQRRRKAQGLSPSPFKQQELGAAEASLANVRQKLSPPVSSEERAAMGPFTGARLPFTPRAGLREQARRTGDLAREGVQTGTGERAETSQLRMIDSLRGQGLSAGQIGQVLEDEGFSTEDIDRLLRRSGARKFPTRADVLTGGAPSGPQFAAPAPTGPITEQFISPATQSPGGPTDIESLIQSRIDAALQPFGDFVQQTTQQEQSRLADTIRQLEEQRDATLGTISEVAQRQKASLATRTEQRLLEARSQATQAREDTAKRFAFRGAGRSDALLGAQSDLARQALNIENEIRREQLLQESLIDAREQGASIDTLNSISNQIQQQNDRVNELRGGFQAQMANLRLQAMETGQASLAGVMEQLNVAAAAAREVDVEQSQQMGFLVDSAGQPILNKSGNIVDLPEDVKQKLQFIAGTRRQQAGVFNPFTGEFSPLQGFGGGGSVGGAALPDVGFDPRKEQIYRDLLEQAQSGLTISQAAADSDLAKKGKPVQELIIETQNYANWIAGQQQPAAAPEQPSPLGQALTNIVTQPFGGAVTGASAPFGGVSGVGGAIPDIFSFR